VLPPPPPASSRTGLVLQLCLVAKTALYAPLVLSVCPKSPSAPRRCGCAARATARVWPWSREAIRNTASVSPGFSLYNINSNFIDTHITILRLRSINFFPFRPSSAFRLRADRRRPDWRGRRRRRDVVRRLLTLARLALWLLAGDLHGLRSAAHCTRDRSLPLRIVRFIKNRRIRVEKLAADPPRLPLILLLLLLHAGVPLVLG
jgi:hypothetical protein